jgi:hypothetical protein
LVGSHKLFDFASFKPENGFAKPETDHHQNAAFTHGMGLEHNCCNWVLSTIAHIIQNSTLIGMMNFN